MEWVDQIGLFDILLVVICLIFFARGIWIGFVRQLATIIAVFAGYYVVAHYSQDIHDLVMPFIDNRRLAFVITYLILLLLIYVAGMLLGLLLKKVMTVTLLTWFDRTLGGIFGLAKGFFVSCLLFMAMAAFLSGTNRLLQNSLSFPVMKASSRAILEAVQDKELRTLFKPKEPAIRPESLPPVERPSADRILPPVVRPQEVPSESRGSALGDNNGKVSL